MLTFAQIVVAALAGAICGFAQSVVVGMIARSWDGGTGLVWGLLLAVPAGISAIWVGWYAITVGAVLSLAVFAFSWLSIVRDRKQKQVL